VNLWRRFLRWKNDGDYWEQSAATNNLQNQREKGQRRGAAAQPDGGESVTTKRRELTHLWRAKLQIGAKADYFYFRAPDELGRASQIAADLADSSPLFRSSPFVQLKAARMVQIECMARLLN
jgi:hypothetical protein